MKVAAQSPGILILLTAILLIAPSVGRCDDESEVLLQYRDRVNASIDLALAFLATTYNSGPYGGGAIFPGPYGNSNAVAGLVGMAFLAKGYVPGESQYGQVINACADKILSTDISAKTSPGPGGKPVIVFPAGYLGGSLDRMYGHSIATLFLSEISGMVDVERQKRIDVVLPKAVKLILDAQRVRKADGAQNGGWRYLPTSTDSDISVSGWCTMALRSAKLNGAPVPAKAINDAIAFVERCRGKALVLVDHGRSQEDGGFWYNPPQWYGHRGYWTGGPSNPARTGVALLCRELSGRHGDVMNRQAGAYILRQMGKARTPAEPYTMYYCSQGMFQLGGTRWEEFAQMMYRTLPPQQKPSGEWKGAGQGPIYATAMYVLALSVSCRQLPIYQR